MSVTFSANPAAASSSIASRPAAVAGTLIMRFVWPALHFFARATYCAVRSACGKLPDVTAPPVPSNLNSPYALQQLTFRVDHATNADIARLEKCLAKFPSVVGITLQDSSDMGS